MRIVCERCAASFVVDEQRLPAGGATAACPRCGEPARLPPVTAVDDAFVLDLPEPGAGRTTGRFPAAPLPPDPLERDGHITGQYAVPDAAAAAYASARGSTGTFGLGRTTGQYSPAPAPPPASAPPPPPSSPALPAPPPEAVQPVEFIADSAPPKVPVVEQTPDDPIAEWRVKKPGAIVEGPFTPVELVARYEAGLLQPADLVAQGTDGFQPLSAYPLTAPFLKPRPQRRARAFASESERDFPWRLVAFAGIAVTGAVLGAVLSVVRPELLFGPGPSPADQAALSILEGWREAEAAPFATAAELSRLARGYAATDTREGRRRAVDTFRRALVRSPDDWKAMAGYAQARALLAIEDGDEAGLRQATELLGYALRKAGTLVEPHVARATILAATGSDGDLLVAQDEAELARKLGPDEPEALLAVGRSFLEKNPKYAMETLELAQRKSPELRAIPLALGEAYLRLGRLADARAAFERRLVLAPDDPAGHLALARLDASLGGWELARTRLAKLPGMGRSTADLRLLEAQIAYQIDGRLELARTVLTELAARDHDRRRKVRALLHLAAVEQAAGRLAEAEQVTRTALDLDPKGAPLQFRLALILLERGQPEEAHAALAKAASAMPDRAQRAIVQARIHAARGRTDDAQAEYARAMALAPLQAGPYLLAAALYAQFGALPQALGLVRRALEADPAWFRAHRALTDYHENRRYLTIAVGGLELLASSQDEVPLVLGAVAAARYQAGDSAGAEKAARRATAAGPRALAARLYLGQLAIDRGRAGEALAQLEMALEIDPRCAPAQVLAARAQLLLGRWDEARRHVRLALDSNSDFVPALARDAEALARAGRREAALALLRQAYRYDPDDIEVRRLLDMIERGETPSGTLGWVEVESEVE